MSSQPTEERTPEEPKAWLFYHAHRVYTRLMSSRVRRFIRLLLFEISPDVPVSLTQLWRHTDLGLVFCGAGSITLILCFGVTAAWSAWNGTLRGSDPGRLYFLSDTANIINYTVLCPLYVALGTTLVVTVFRGWAQLDALVTPSNNSARSAAASRAMLAVLLVLLASSVLSVQYVREVLDPRVYARAHWFIDSITPDGRRILGPFGMYYGILNFILLAFSLSVLIVFLSAFRLCLDIGRSLSSLRARQPMSTAMLQVRLTTFTQAYLAAKLVSAFTC
jgi:hypothetical protein